MFFVYKITNLVNGKIYIGKTKNIRNRWSSHKAAARRKNKNDYTYLHRAINKHGEDNFAVEELARFEDERECLDEEVRLIKLYNSKNRSVGYNLTDGGDGVSGYIPSKEAREKMNIAKKNSLFRRRKSFLWEKSHRRDKKKA